MSSPRVAHRSKKSESSKKKDTSGHANSTEKLHKKDASPGQSKPKRRSSIVGYSKTRSKSEVRKNSTTDTRTKTIHEGNICQSENTFNTIENREM